MKKTAIIIGTVTGTVVLLAALLFGLLFLIEKFETTEKTSVSDYLYAFSGAVDDWNRQTTRRYRRESLTGFGEYLYNSELLLFPREAPSGLREYYFYWAPLIDVDAYAIYFSCELSEDRFDAFSEGLNAFSVKTDEGEIRPLYDDAHFDLPAYILQWKNVGEKWEVLEYVMLDADKHTAVFVYTMGELERIEKNSSYTVTPSQPDIIDGDFSIYGDYSFEKYGNSYDGFDSAEYDLSLLDCLK